MPLFFFISGFVLYKAGVVWSFQHVGAFLKKKFPIQILATAVFFILYVYFAKLNWWNMFVQGHKGGYWFTYVLFVYYVLYSVLRLSFRKHEDIVVLLLAICFYPLGGQRVFDAIPLSDETKGILSIEQWNLFTFFLLGTLVKKHFAAVQKALDGKLLVPVSVVLYFVLNIFDDYLWETGPAFHAVCLVKTLSGMVLVFGFFRANQHCFQKTNVLGRSIQYIGRRTLDIYFLHYFFLPRNLGEIVPFFHDHPMPLMEFAFTLLVALMIVAASLLLSNVIRLSPTLGHFLFGAKIERPAHHA